MSITFPADLEATIRKLVENGRYRDPEAALREAVRLLGEIERKRVRLEAMLQVGIDAADRSEVDEWTPELRDRLRREAAEMFERGEEPDPDVLP